MEIKMKSTGERLVTDIMEYWTLEHLHRYALACDFIVNKDVVDIASGEGYGSFLMAEKATSLIGIDISQAAVDHANQKYKRDNLNYITGSAALMPIPDHSVDVLISFETIEHHDQHDKMLAEIKRVLRPGGLVIISSPDKKYYSDLPGYNNPFHIKELYKEEFRSLLSANFKYETILSQKTIFGSVIAPENGGGVGLREYSGNYNQISSSEKVEDAVYLIGFASDSPLPQKSINSNHFFYNQDVFFLYRDALNEYRKLLKENQLIKNSTTFRLGAFFVSPYRMLKKIFK